MHLTDVRTIDIPDSVLRIEKWAFRDCRSLVHIRIPDSTVDIGIEAFANCARLVSAIVPEGCNVSPDAFPPNCHICGDEEGYRRFLAQGIATAREGDPVEIVGMTEPAQGSAPRSLAPGRGMA